MIYAVGIFLKNARFHYYSVLWLALIFSSVFFDFELGFAMIGLGGRDVGSVRMVDGKICSKI